MNDMTRDELKDALSRAGITFDGHVTNGSIAAQMDVIDRWISREIYKSDDEREHGYGWGV